VEQKNKKPPNSGILGTQNSIWYFSKKKIQKMKY